MSQAYLCNVFTYRQDFLMSGEHRGDLIEPTIRGLEKPESQHFRPQGFLLEGFDCPNNSEGLKAGVRKETCSRVWGLVDFAHVTWASQVLSHGLVNHLGNILMHKFLSLRPRVLGTGVRTWNVNMLKAPCVTKTGNLWFGLYEPQFFFQRIVVRSSSLSWLLCGNKWNSV